MKTIGIDARFWGVQSRGLGRYTGMLLRQLEKIDFKNRYFVFLKKDNFSSYHPHNKNFIKKLADVSWYSLEEQLTLPFIFKKEPVDLMHFPHFNVPLLYRKPFIVTIHDLILMEHPTQKATTLGPFRYFIKQKGYEMVLKNAISHSQEIIAVSHFTKIDLIKHFPSAGAKIKVIYEACGISQSQLNFKRDGKEKGNMEEKEIIIKNQKLRKPYLLYVGAAYPHKNIENLLLGYQKVKQKNPWKDLELVLVGGDDYFYKRVKDFSSGKRIEGVKFLGLIKKEEDLDLIYEKASLFVFPSFYEGFGLPPLEAMEKGVPVVASKAASIPEVLGKAAIYFSPYSVPDIAEKIYSVLENKKLQEDLIHKGKERVQLFNWQKTAQETLKIYNSFLEKNESKLF